MTNITILTGQAETAHGAKSQLLRDLETYIEKEGWVVQGGISHVVIPPLSPTQKPTHYMSVLLIKT